MSGIPKEVVAFRARNGQVPFEKWLDDLNDKKAVARVLARLARVRQGKSRRLQISRRRRERVASGLRAGLPGYFGQKGRTLVVLLCGGDKRTQDRDIRLAKQHWHEFKGSDL